MAAAPGFTIEQLLAATPSTLYGVKGDEPIISAGLHLSALDVEGVVAMDREGRADGIVIGYNVLRLINPKNLWSTFYQTKISAAKMRVLLAKPQDGLEKTVKSIMKRGWGYAVVADEQGKPVRLIGLLDLASFYVKSGMSEGFRSSHVRGKGSTPVITIDEKTTASMAVQKMLGKHVRRLLLKESGLILSDRGVIKWLLSPETTAKLRDSPRDVLETPLSGLSQFFHKPALVDPDADLPTALKLLDQYDARCLVTKDHNEIITPWDLTIRLLAG